MDATDGRLSIDEMREAVPFKHWREVLTFGTKRPIIWNDGSVGVAAFYHGEQPDDVECDWFKEGGWLPYVFDLPGRKAALIAPLVYVESPMAAFHATPREHAIEILNGEAGILSGRSAKKSTTRRPDASRFIHVSLNVQDARTWAEDDRLLRKTWPGDGWTILEIDLVTPSLRLFRDPQSATGYIVESECIPRAYISIHSEFGIGSSE